MIQLTENIFAIELTRLGDEFKNIKICPADNKWLVPYLKYSYRSIYHTRNFKKDFYCRDEIPLEIPGDYEFIYTSQAAEYAEASQIVEKVVSNMRAIHYKNYDESTPIKFYLNPVVSLFSLISSKLLNPELDYAIIKKL